MKKQNAIILFIFIVFLCFATTFGFHLYVNNYRVDYEHFTSTNCSDPEYNLLHNGSFQNGKYRNPEDIRTLHCHMGNSFRLQPMSHFCQRTREGFELASFFRKTLAIDCCYHHLLVDIDTTTA